MPAGATILSESAATGGRRDGLWQADELLGRVYGDAAFRAKHDGAGAAGFQEQLRPIEEAPALPASASASVHMTPAAAVPLPALPDDSAPAATQAPVPQQASPVAAAALAVIDESLRQQIRETAHAEGILAGRAAMQSEMHRGLEREKQGVRELLQALRGALTDQRQFFAPLERLAVHLAVQLVRGELTLSGVAIRRLVENCLLEVEHRGEKLTLRLHPADLEKFSLLQGELSDDVELVRDPALTRGSVKLEMADGAIEDLIEHRLEALACSVLGAQASGQLKPGSGSGLIPAYDAAAQVVTDDHDADS